MRIWTSSLLGAAAGLLFLVGCGGISPEVDKLGADHVQTLKEMIELREKKAKDPTQAPEVDKRLRELGKRLHEITLRTLVMSEVEKRRYYGKYEKDIDELTARIQSIQGAGQKPSTNDGKK